ncbi:LysR family transcriptional regulator, partial [Salinisphaera sp. USBA-960]|nr:LysR family transcriptional regulator [Salifodinibacter halophilus]
HRTTRQLHATAEGQALAERGRALIEELEGLTDDLRRAGSEPAGLVRVTTSASFGRMYLSPLLPEFQRRYPLVRLSVNLSDEN